jgi:hypothetical protein
MSVYTRSHATTTNRRTGTVMAEVWRHRAGRSATSTNSKIRDGDRAEASNGVTFLVGNNPIRNWAPSPALTPLPTTTATGAYASKDSIGRMQKVRDARRLAAGEQKQEAKGEEPPHLMPPRRLSVVKKDQGRQASSLPPPGYLSRQPLGVVSKFFIERIAALWRP